MHQTRISYFIKNETTGNYLEMLTKFQITSQQNNVFLTSQHHIRTNYVFQHIIFIYIAIWS